MVDYYKVLGVEKNASDNTIKQAYKDLAKKHHPDLGGNEEKFKQINEAYDTLKNPETRKAYDNPNPFQGMGGNSREGFHFTSANINLDDIMRQMHEHMFRESGQGGFRTRHRQSRNHNLNINLTIDLKELAEGDDIEKHISVRMSDGSREFVKINIPAHIETGQTVKYPQLGDNANPDLTRGDLFVTINIKTNNDFEKKGLDLLTTITIDSIDAILGTEQIIQTLTGKNLKLKIPAGTQFGAILKLGKEGLKFRNSSGDILAQILIRTPTNLSTEQLDHIRKAKS